MPLSDSWRYRTQVPDAEDYATLPSRLADPESWSPEDAEKMRGLLKSQREAAAAWHPKDTKRRAEMTPVADDIEEAIKRYDAR